MHVAAAEADAEEADSMVEVASVAEGAIVVDIQEVSAEQVYAVERE